MKSSYLSFLLAAATIVVAKIPDGVLKYITPALEKCTKKHGTSMDAALKIIEEMKLPDTPEMKCTYDCYFVEVGYLKNDKMDWDEIIASHYVEYPDDPGTVGFLNKLIGVCKEIVNFEGKKFCEFSETLMACNYEQAKKL